MKAKIKTVREILADRAVWRAEVNRLAGPGDIVVDPGEEVICDACNDSITESAHVMPDRAWCAKCWDKYS